MKKTQLTFTLSYNGEDSYTISYKKDQWNGLTTSILEEDAKSIIQSLRLKAISSPTPLYPKTIKYV